MVTKINNGSSIFGAVSYNQEKVNNQKAKIIFSNKMIENISGKEEFVFSQTLRSFEPYLLANKKTKKTVVHISINPSPEDKLSDQEFAFLARDYMEKMGFKDQPYIVYKHEDIDRKHIHIVSVRVDENGNKINDSYEKLRSMDACRELEIQYSLKQITNKKDENSIYYLNKFDYNKGDVKRQISNTIKSLIEGYKFQSFGEYNALLSCFNIHCKVVKGEEKGNIYTGIVYSATTDNGESRGNPIKSSRIGKNVGFGILEKIMKKTTEEMRQTPASYKSKNLISGLMKSTRNKDFFIRKMKENNIDVIFRTNDTERIYGVTFVDHSQKMVYNGSRLGKEFSANVFNDLFSGKKQQTGFNPKQEQTNFTPYNNEGIAAPFDKETSLEPIFGLLAPDVHGDNYEEELFKRKAKRKRNQHKKGF